MSIMSMFPMGSTATADGDIPVKLADLEDDSGHRTVSDAEKAEWSGKEDSGTAERLISTLSIPSKTSELTNDSGFITNADIPDSPVISVNGMNGVVKIDIPTKVSELENDSGYLKSYTESDPTVPAWAKSANKPSYTKSEVGLGNVENIKQYSASNPPPYPVTSVNGTTGAVTVNVPTTLAELTGDANHRTVTDTEKAAWNAKVDQTTLANYSTTAEIKTYIDETFLGGSW